MSTDPRPTPRTDAVTYEVTNLLGERVRVIPASIAKLIERELAAKGEELARLDALVECMPRKQRELAQNVIDLHAAIDKRDEEFTAQTAAAAGLRAAAQAVVDRWDTPLWKHAPHTGEFIARLREALTATPSPWRDAADEYYAILGKCTGLWIGCCTGEGKEDVLRTSDTGKLVPISKELFERFGDELLTLDDLKADVLPPQPEQEQEGKL